MEKQRRTEYKLPDDALRRMVDWMTAAEAAQAWGCHRTTARRYMRQRRDQTHSRLIVLVRGNNRRRVLVCPVAHRPRA